MIVRLNAPTPLEVTCPECGTPFRARLYALIDADLDPTLRRRFLAGEVNRIRCPTCGLEELAEVPLLWTDAGRGQAFLALPDLATFDDEEAWQWVSRLTGALEVEGIPLVQDPRLVDGYWELAQHLEATEDEVRPLLEGALALVDDPSALRAFLLARPGLWTPTAFQIALDRSVEEEDPAWGILADALADLRQEYLSGEEQTLLEAIVAWVSAETPEEAAAIRAAYPLLQDGDRVRDWIETLLEALDPQEAELRALLRQALERL